MNTPATWLPASSTILEDASTVALTCSGVRLIVHTANNTTERRSAATSALKANIAGSLTADLSLPTITIASGSDDSTASLYAATISALDPLLSLRARLGHTPTHCSRESPALLASSSTSVNVSFRQTEGRNTAVLPTDANALVTPNATTLRPFAASGLMIVTLVRLTVSPVRYSGCVTALFAPSVILMRKQRQTHFRDSGVFFHCICIR